MGLKVIFEKLYPTFSKKLWKFILDESVHLFIQMLLICSLKFMPDERLVLVDKIKIDMKSMEELFLNLLSSRDVDPSIEKLTIMINALTGPPNDIPGHIFKLKVALDKKWNDNCSVSIGLIEEMPAST